MPLRITKILLLLFKPFMRILDYVSKKVAVLILWATYPIIAVISVAMFYTIMTAGGCMFKLVHIVVTNGSLGGVYHLPSGLFDLTPTGLCSISGDPGLILYGLIGAGSALIIAELFSFYRYLQVDQMDARII